MLRPVESCRPSHSTRSSCPAWRSCSAMRRRAGRAVLEQDAELVPAQPRQRIALAQVALQHAADLAQHLVTGLVAAGVVDELELVQVHEEQGALAPHGARLAEQGFQPALELAPVHQAGERIVAGLPGQLFHIVLLARHVVQHQHGARGPALVADRGTHQLDGHQALVGAHHRGGEAIAVRGAAAQHPLHQLVGAQGAGAIIELQHLGQGATGGLVRRHAQQGLGCGIEVEHRAMRVGGHHGIANGRQRDVGLLALRVERQLRTLALGQQRPGVPGGQQDQHGGHPHVGPEQPLHDAPRAVPQRRAEGAGRRRRACVDGADAGLPVPARGGVHHAGGMAVLDLLRQVQQAVDVAVPYQPVHQRLLHDLVAVEPAQQPDQAVDVVRVVLAAGKPLACGLQVDGVRLHQGQPGCLVAQRDVDGLPELHVGIGGAGSGVAVQVVDGVLLPLGPEALARDESAHRRQHVQAARGAGRQQQHHQQERPGDPQRGAQRSLA